MRRAMVVIAGIMVALGLVIGPPPAGAATNSCSLDGTYVVSGLGRAGGAFFQVEGSLVFTPNTADCGAGDIAGFISFEQEGQIATNFLPTGSYFVDPQGRFFATLPEIQLDGHVALTVGDPIAHGIVMVAKFNNLGGVRPSRP